MNFINIGQVLIMVRTGFARFTTLWFSVENVAQREEMSQNKTQ